MRGGIKFRTYFSGIFTIQALKYFILTPQMKRDSIYTFCLSYYK